MKHLLFLIFLSVSAVPFSNGAVYREDMPITNIEKGWTAIDKVKANSFDGSPISIVRKLNDNGVNQHPTSDKDNKVAEERLGVSVQPLSDECQNASSDYSNKGGDITVTENVINKCMLKANDFTTTPNNFEAKLMPYIVYLRSDSDICTGLLINSTTIITARHCSVSVAYLSNGDIRNLTPQDRVPCKVVSSDYCDYVTIKIEKTSIAPPDIQWADASKNDKLFISGISISDVNTAPKKFSKNIIYATDDNDNKNCRAIFTNDKCIVHLCTVLKGFSGAPILNVDKSRSARKIVISGIHISSSKYLINDLCKYSGPPLLANYGMQATTLSH